MPPVITVENISKKYIIGHQAQERYTTLRDALANGAKRFTDKLRHPFAAPESDPTHEEFWALKDVSFDIQQGDRVGIIGRNGAGKSTLLKILSRITEPTSGKVSIKGRVASLLEVGTGFHPELTGRENVYLNGAILGMSKAEIKKKFDEIVAFAEVEKFLDTPVKRYSSGMYVRLAFAVAAHLEPEILIVDEVLAVGDAQFQKKCLGKMQDVGTEGRTVLFVSHNIAAIKTLCSRGVLLNKGGLIFDGKASEAIDSYQESDHLKRNEIVWADHDDAPGNELIKLKSIKISPLHGTNLDIDSGVEITTVFYNAIAGKNIDLTLYLYSLENICIFETWIIITNNNDAKAGYYTTKVVIPAHLLNFGVYKITMLFGESQRYELYKIEDVVSFEIEHTATGRGSNMNPTLGMIRPILNWTVNYDGQERI
jgi:lipopolysaccharide transport system ATP-binding protein